MTHKSPLKPLIEQMTPDQQRRFALACAKRALPIYKASDPDDQRLKIALFAGRRILRDGNFDGLTKIMEACWQIVLNACPVEGDPLPDYPAGAAALAIVEALELLGMGGDLTTPTIRISELAAQAYIFANTPYEPDSPGFMASYIEQMTAQRAIAQKVLER